MMIASGCDAVAASGCGPGAGWSGGGIDCERTAAGGPEISFAGAVDCRAGSTGAFGCADVVTADSAPWTGEGAGAAPGFDEG